MVRFFIAFDQPLVRLGLRESLGREGHRCVGEAETAEQAVAGIRSTLPDVAILDLGIEGGGIPALRKLRKECSRTRVILYASAVLAEDIWEGIRVGASAFVFKDASPQHLLDTVCRVHAGRHLSSPDWWERILEDRPGMGTGKLAPVDSASRPLSPREREILRLAADGLTYRDIGLTLGISAETVKTHFKNIRRKTGLSDRRQVISFAIREGIMPNRA